MERPTHAINNLFRFSQGFVEPEVHKWDSQAVIDYVNYLESLIPIQYQGPERRKHIRGQISTMIPVIE